MSWYVEKVVPRLVEAGLSLRITADTRREVCEGLTGRVVEIGFGSGLNVPFYPDDLESVDAVEPSDLGWQRAQDRVRSSPVSVRRSGLDGQRLPFEDASFDSALCTWTLCTVPDPSAAVAELRRVLRPGGTLHLVEHGLAPDEGVQTWQRRLEPLQRRAFGGCHLTREVPALLTAGGFSTAGLRSFYEKGAPKPFVALTLGTAS